MKERNWYFSIDYLKNIDVNYLDYFNLMFLRMLMEIMGSFFRK